MSNEKEKFSTEEKNDVNPIGKIISTLFFLVVGVALVVLVFSAYKNIWVSSLIILAVGFILLAVWNKNFYIYRYMLPAIVIILVFTAYPIVFTVYIAFTNFGTGHMQTKDEARNILLTSNWAVDYDSQPLFAEFYAPKKEINEYITAYLKAFEEFDYKMAQEKKKGRSEEDIENMWDIDFFATKQPELVKNSLGRLKKEDFTIILYSKKSIDLNNPEETEETVPDQEKTLKVYISEKGSNQLKEINLTDVPNYAKGKILLGDTVYKREGLERAEKDIDENNAIMVSISDFREYYEQLADKFPLKLGTSEYLIEQANQFLSKRHTYKIDEKDPKIMWKLNTSNFQYDRKIFEDNKYGKFSATVDSEAPKYWNQYEVSSLEFDYGPLNLERNSYAEDFLEKKIAEDDLKSKLIFNQKSEIEGNPIDLINKDKKKELNLLKEEINNANKYIKEFNSKIGKYKEEFLSMSKEKIMNDLPDLPLEIEKLAFESKILSKITNEEGKKFLLFYYRVRLVGTDKYYLEKDKITDDVKKNLWAFLNSSGYFNIQKEKNKKISDLTRVHFPKLALIKLITIGNANLETAFSIEPGYSVVVGLSNFNKIISSRNITAPFLFVFLWTILWSAISVISSFAMGLALALVFNASDFKGKYIYRTLFILPYAIPSFVTILMWNGFLNKDFGVINNAFGITVPWLMEGYMAKMSTLVVNLWLSFPYFMIISLGALQSIDSTIYEAANVDGASNVQQFTILTLPLLLIALGPMLVGSFAFAFNNFAGIYLLTGGGPTMAAGVLPGHTDILISYTYKLAFGEQNKDYGLASAIAIIVFLIIGTLTFVNFKLTGTFKEVDNA